MHVGLSVRRFHLLEDVTNFSKAQYAYSTLKFDFASYKLERQNFSEKIIHLKMGACYKICHFPNNRPNLRQ
jgi:hypothetical protein